MKQLALPLQLREHTTLENYARGSNSAAVDYLINLAQCDEEKQAFIWSRENLGKTHLLQALCHLASEHALTCAYLPLKTLKNTGADVLHGMERVNLVCLDDLHEVVNHAAWAAEIFHLINRCRAAGCSMVFAANEHPKNFMETLPDLRSRLMWGPVFALQSLDDQELQDFVLQRSRQRGVVMTEDVARYLVEHCPRDIAQLLKLVKQLDEESLAQKRRLSVPFAKKVLAL